MARKRSTVTADPAACPCAGAAHLVCRPGAWAGASVSAFLEADKSAPPPLARVFDCGCHGAAHPVCDGRWDLIREARAEAKPVRRLTLKQALKDGLTLTPHIEHSYTCPPNCPAEMRHEHFCYCNRGERGTGRLFTEAERWTTVREPIAGRG